MYKIVIISLLTLFFFYMIDSLGTIVDFV